MSANPAASHAADSFRLDEWNALPDECFIAGCDGGDIDQRGPVWTRDGAMHKACVEHWEPIFRVLGEQASWERTDAMRANDGATLCLREVVVTCGTVSDPAWIDAARVLCLRQMPCDNPHHKPERVSSK